MFNKIVGLIKTEMKEGKQFSNAFVINYLFTIIQIRSKSKNKYSPYNPNKTSTGSLAPNNNLVGFSIISFTLTRKLTDSFPSMIL